MTKLEKWKSESEEQIAAHTWTAPTNALRILALISALKKAKDEHDRWLESDYPASMANEVTRQLQDDIDAILGKCE